MTVPSATSDPLAAAIREQEERLSNCVHCGFCLPACPTYRRLGDEADSPRGRLHLMRAVVEGRLDPGSEAFRVHIGRCLGCRACEPVCPSGVTYGHLLELARQVGNTAQPPSLLTRLLLQVFGSAWIARPAMALSRLFRATRLPAVLAKLPGKWLRGSSLALAMLAASAPVKVAGMGASSTQRRRETAHEGKATSPDRASAENRPRAHNRPRAQDGTPPPTVGILDGCVQAGLFSRVNAATARVLETNGFRVVKVPGQGCCGALHAHAGDLESARDMAKRNIEAFERARVDHLAMNASGCGAAMAEYGTLLAHDEEWASRAEALAARVLDVTQLLVQRGPIRGGAMPMTVTYDAPCHLLHAQGVTTPLDVLAAIPDLRVKPLTGSAECCGGAGIYGITHPRLGGWIGDDKVQNVLDTGADALVTGNPGCMMQIGGGLRLAGSKVPALHVVELLDESYRRAGRYDRTT